MCYFTKRDKVVQKGIDRCIEELPDFCKQFLTYTNLKLSKLTTRSYLYVVRMFFHHYATGLGVAYSILTIKDLNNVTHGDVEKWLETFKGKIETNTIIYRHSVMKTFLGYFYTRREINQNVVEQILMPKLQEKPINRLTLKQVNDLLSAVDNGIGLLPPEVLLNHRVPEVQAYKIPIIDRLWERHVLMAG